MLRRRILMAEYGLPSPRENRRASSSLFTPRLFTGFAPKAITDSESLMSPTSILDSKPFSAFRNPFWSDPITPKTPKSENRIIPWEKLDVRGVGLGLVDILTNEKSDSKLTKPDSPVVLFGPQLKIQVPPLPPSVNSPVNSPKSPVDFGIKKKNSQIGPFSPASSSPSPVKKSPFGSLNSGLENSNSPRDISNLSISEMELSEDYTRVISHGPIPKTTHIFDDCVVESSYSNVAASLPNQENPSADFLSICCHCKDVLKLGKDIYMYRGEKAFCSPECREMQMKKEESDDH